MMSVRCCEDPFLDLIVCTTFLKTAVRASVCGWTSVVILRCLMVSSFLWPRACMVSLYPAEDLTEKYPRKTKQALYRAVRWGRCEAPCNEQINVC